MMNISRKYTAQEMREAASTCETVEVADQFYAVEMDHAAAMLRQAADTEEELMKLRGFGIGELLGQRAALKARLDAVERACVAHISMRCRSQCKIAEDGVPKSLNGKPCYTCNVCDLTPEELAQTGAATEILCVVRGEGEK